MKVICVSPCGPRIRLRCDNPTFHVLQGGAFMYRSAICSFVLFLFLFLLASAPVAAHDTQPWQCHFHERFATLRDTIGHEIVGDCQGNESPLMNHEYGRPDTMQMTSGGMMIWRTTSDNRMAFTNGHHTWIIGPNGLVKRLNTETFAWEATPAPTAPPPSAPTPAPDPTPTPAPQPPAAPNIDEEFKSILQVMRSTGPIGEHWYNQVYALGANIVFDPVGLCGKTACHIGGNVWIAQSFYTKHQDNPSFLASVIVHELAHAVWRNEQGLDTTTEGCFANETNSERHRARWLIERYGDRVDHWEVIKAYQAGTLLEYVKSVPRWREHCGKYGVAPTPTPQPESVECWTPSEAESLMAARSGLRGNLHRRYMSKLMPAINTVEFTCEALKDLGYRVTTRDLSLYLTSPADRSHMLCIIDPHLDQRNRTILRSLVSYGECDEG